MTRASFSLDMHVQLQIREGLHDHDMQQFTHSVGLWPGQCLLAATDQAHSSRCTLYVHQ